MALSHVKICNLLTSDSCDEGSHVDADLFKEVTSLKVWEKLAYMTAN